MKIATPHDHVALVIGVIAYLVLLAMFDVPLMGGEHEVLIFGWPFISTFVIALIYLALFHNACARCGHPFGPRRKEMQVLTKTYVPWSCRFCGHGEFREESPDNKCGNASVR